MQQQQRRTKLDVRPEVQAAAGAPKAIPVDAVVLARRAQARPELDPAGMAATAELARKHGAALVRLWLDAIEGN